ncbi:MAG: hypothetical protein SP1CHLAM54_03260 [Chlamydiia bacterium]|nr:hypothetical protein [Chlamydiia bacterium]MCH9615242.1 hypothetical protein [Chlamydiia bacterium]MCH9628436.1 hypothetical protein [Chlamydiia bacterium]
MKNSLVFSLLALLLCMGCQTEEKKTHALKKLHKQYNFFAQHPSDINEHLPTIRKYARECESVLELGIRGVVSTWGSLVGLTENGSKTKTYIGVDIDPVESNKLKKLKKLSKRTGINYTFIHQDDMQVKPRKTDLLFIDTLHTYSHLMYELEKFSPQTKKYIICHDTSADFENTDWIGYTGDRSEYPKHISREKRGLWPAVLDFLATHPEWELLERHQNNNGLTVLKRR